MFCSVLLATAGRTQVLHRFLGSMTDQTWRNFEIIVIEQNPDDRLVKVLAEYTGRMTLRHLRSAPGHSKALNIGLQHIRGDVVAFPDDDCWYDADVLERVALFFRQNPGWGGLTGREIVEPGFS